VAPLQHEVGVSGAPLKEEVGLRAPLTSTSCARGATHSDLVRQGRHSLPPRVPGAPLTSTSCTGPLTPTSYTTSLRAKLQTPSSSPTASPRSDARSEPASIVIGALARRAYLARRAPLAVRTDLLFASWTSSAARHASRACPVTLPDHGTIVTHKGGRQHHRPGSVTKAPSRLGDHTSDYVASRLAARLLRGCSTLWRVGRTPTTTPGCRR
jgi:hypothetical protein